MVTAAGSGYSRWRNTAVTRWREDSTRDCWGSISFCGINRLAVMWSAGYQPTGVEPDSYEAAFFEDHAEFSRRDRSWLPTLKSSFRPKMTRKSGRFPSRIRELARGTFRSPPIVEISLTSQAADLPTRPLPIYLWRPSLPQRGRDSGNASETIPGGTVDLGRARVRGGRNRWRSAIRNGSRSISGTRADLRTPISIADGRPLSNSVGSVLDPVMSLRRTVRIPAGTTTQSYSPRLRLRPANRCGPCG